MTSTFVFMHVGSDIAMPTAMVASIRRQISNANVIQCTDKLTSVVPGVSQVVRTEMQSNRIMHSRLNAFSGLSLRKPALYLDTDMLLLRPIDIGKILPEGASAVLCKRSFQRDLIFNHKFRGLDFIEYKGKTLGEVFPYIACATVTESFEFWEDCLYALDILDEKYHVWYGDQESIKIVAASERYRFSTFPESLYGCLPEKVDPGKPPYLVHFKGPTRKGAFNEWRDKLHL